MLQAFQGKNAVPLSKAAAKLDTLTPFVRLPSRPDGSVLLPPRLLQDAKTTLRALDEDGLEVLISPDIDALRLVEMPPGFCVKYAWDAVSRTIGARATDEAVYFGEGWFVGGDCYWQVQGTVPEDDRWLGRITIEGPDIVILISQVAADWQRRGLPYVCDVHLDQSPALKFTVKQVLDDAVEMDVAWRVLEASVQEIPSLPGYVAVGSTLMPGVSPQTLLRSLPLAVGSLRVVGQQVPQFMRYTWPAVRAFAGGYAEDLARAHSVLDGAAELTLTVGSQMRDGLGIVTAVPTVSVGNTGIDATEVSRQIDIHTEYVRADTAWIPRSSLNGLGIGPMGRLDDGTPLKTIKLTRFEVLNRGSQRLDGPWSRIEFPEMRLPQGRSPAETARLHVEFLRRWCIPGGVVSTSQDVLRALAESMASVVGQFPTAKALVVGTRETLGSLDAVWTGCRGIRLDGLKKDPKIPSGFRGLVAASPRALETAPELLRTQWTIVCLLEADALVRSDSSKFFASLRSCRKSLVIGLFGGTDFLKRTAAREAIAQIFDVASYDSIELFEEYGLRDPAKSPPALPSPYRLHRRGVRRQEKEEVRPAEIRLGGLSASGGLAIPQRPAPGPMQTLEPKTGPSKPIGEIELTKIEYGYTTSHGTFVTNARQLVGHREKQASFVPFMCYWPTYDSMTPAQRKWYFYWRGQARDGNYIDTDLSYIFVHIYELINNVGVKDAIDGSEQLRRLWMGYRERFPKLDGYLAAWLTDYILANRCGRETIKAHIEALPPGVGIHEPDPFLGYFVGASPLWMPVALIQALSDYRFDKSKFYLDGNQDLLCRTLPGVLDCVNTHLLGKAGLGVFDLLRPRTVETVKRYLFQGAVYAASSQQVAAIATIPYSKHPPLREFMTGLVKHTENRLRELNGYEGRLRGYSLDPAIQAVVDEFLGFQAKTGAATTKSKAEARIVLPPPRVVIDMSRVQDLERESDEVRDILLGSIEAAETEVQQAIETQVVAPQDMNQPPGGVEQLQPDQDPIDVFLARLTNEERCLIDTMAKWSWEAAEDVLRQALPGLLLEPLVDRINEHAIELLGDILIAPEEDLLVVSDDLRDDLSRRLGAQTGGREQTEEQMISTHLSAEWAAFSSGLAAHQLETLRIIIEVADPMPGIRSIAEDNAIMPGLLIDSINELALDTIGDHIIEPGSEPPTIEDEDREMVGRVVAALVTR